MASTNQESPYELDGKPLPRVSQICRSWSPFSDVERLMNWAVFEQTRGNDWREVFERAGEVGNLAHYLIETIGQEGNGLSIASPVDVQAAAVAACHNWIDWASHLGDFEFIEREKKMISPLGFGGTCDAIIRINGGGNWICDWKTGSKIKLADMLQQSAYQILAAENGYDVQGAIIVRLGKKWDGDEPVQDWQEMRIPNAVLEEYQEAFIRLFEVHSILDGVSKPRSKTHKSARRKKDGHVNYGDGN